jgi:hypothetical protein
MALSQIKICNLALSHIGVKQTITDITDENEEAEMCDLHWDSALEDALGEFDWTFARRRVDLVAETGDAPSPWGYQFQYPDNCVIPLRIDDGRTIRQDDEEIPFSTETTDAEDRLLYCNEEAPTLIYTRLETNPALFTSWFGTYLSWVLAARICGPLTGDEKLEDRTEARAEREMTKAVRKDARSEKEPPQLDATWVDARQ